MGYYIAANEFHKGYAARESIQLDTALTRFARWDVFVSHKSNDAAKAVQIAERISMNGLSAWVDVADPTVVRDGPDLADYIRRVLTSSRSLLALVTSPRQPFAMRRERRQAQLLQASWQRCQLRPLHEPKSLGGCHSRSASRSSRKNCWLPMEIEQAYRHSCTSGPMYKPKRSWTAGAGNCGIFPRARSMPLAWVL